MMCRFLSADFTISLKCPVDKTDHAVRFQAYPLHGHTLDVLACDAAPQAERLTCGKTCRALLENGKYWQTIYPESALYARSE